MRLLLLTAALLIARAELSVGVADELVREESSSEIRPVRVLIIVRDDCPECDKQLESLSRTGGPFDLLTAKGWKIGHSADDHVQIVNQKEIPDLVASLSGADYPAIAATDGREVVRYFKTGCTTPLDQWTIGWLMTGKNERPAEPVLEPARVATTGQYRLRGNHWSVEGDFNPSKEKVVAHLQGPNHARSVASYGQIEDWSVEELRSLHDDLHEK